ncbi:hypothetical protein BJ875DRAFT_271572 [Amylocarpus encephaloides]|uniref:Uncharacterized protein n=1 Tax=Amylocarpus encephaloides TaxID=45428 RepID=A0A9P8C6L4_9HELO|nr:hypothetical protein BJ875DRAFT_271572 [Amylocarpus encephaloides]
MAHQDPDPSYRPPSNPPARRRPPSLRLPTSKSRTSTKRAHFADTNPRARKSAKFSRSKGPSSPYPRRGRVGSEDWKFERRPNAVLPRNRGQAKKQMALDALRQLQKPVEDEETVERQKIRAENLSVLLDAVEVPSRTPASESWEGKYGPGRTSHQNKNNSQEGNQSPTYPKTPHDLDLSCPLPLHRSDYDPHPIDDRSDEWFISQFKELKDQFLIFAETYFGFTEAGEEEKVGSAWVDSDVGKEFIAWASQVCQPDNGEDWETMLEDKELVWVVVGILSRVVKKYVFDESLFGAREVEKEHLGTLERAMLTRGGKFYTSPVPVSVRTGAGH